MHSIHLKKVSNALVLASLFGAGALLVASTPARAGNANANLSVTASVNANCTISTTAVAFGAYDPVVANASTALNGNGTVSIACTKGSAPNVTMDLGLNANVSQRNMLITSGGTDVLAYQLYQPPNTTPGTPCSFPGSQVWGTAGGAIFTPTAPMSVSTIFDGVMITLFDGHVEAV